MINAVMKRIKYSADAKDNDSQIKIDVELVEYFLMIFPN
jgi:hypothetical protein